MTTYFFDENISHRIVSALSVLGANVVHIRDELGLGAADTEWIPYVGEKKWVLVTQDRQILKRPHERLALQSANIVAIFLHQSAFTSDSAFQQAAWILHRWDAIEKVAKRAKGGTHFRVRAQGLKPEKLPPL